MTTFPEIPDYMLYVQNRNSFELRRAMKHFGLSRFMVNGVGRKNAHLTARQVKQLHGDLLGDPWFRTRFELAIEKSTEPIMRVTTPEGDTDYPTWNLATDSALDLRDLARENERVYIRNTVTNIQIAKSADTVIKRRVRELWEVVNEYGDLGLGRCRFVLYGYYQLQLAYCMGLSGSAVYPVYREGPHLRIVRPSGKVERYDHSRIFEYAEDYGISEEYVGPEQLVVRGRQLIPEYLKNFYDGLERIEGKNLLSNNPRDYLVSTLNYGYVGNRPHANIWTVPGDKRLCDHCSINFSCRLYQRGAVCALPGSNERSLSALFGSRDAKDVIEGMGKVLQFQVDRFEHAAEDEYKAREAAKNAGEDPPPLDPEINKMANDIQRNAKQYAVLLNPTLLKPQVQIAIANGKVAQVPAPTEISGPELAKAARELEAAGHDRASITPSMVYDYIANGGKQVIEGEVIDGMKRDF